MEKKTQKNNPTGKGISHFKDGSYIEEQELDSVYFSQGEPDFDRFELIEPTNGIKETYGLETQRIIDQALEAQKERIIKELGKLKETPMIKGEYPGLGMLKIDTTNFHKQIETNKIIDQAIETVRKG